MIRTFLLVVIAVVAIAAEPVVLLTGYGPFAGRGVNGSETVARKLDQALIAGHRIHVRILPVRWGEPQRVLGEAVPQLKPVLLLGLGEGHPGRVAIELIGRNRAAGPDEQGAPPPANLGEGTAERAARFVFDPAWFGGAKVPVAASDDAGSYLCNAWLWYAAGLSTAKVGFVHVPPQGKVPSDAYAAAFVPVISELIARQFAK